MSDHLWFIPVAGGGTGGGLVSSGPGQDALNVYYQAGLYPFGVTESPLQLRIVRSASIPTSNTPGTFAAAYASFSWLTCGDTDCDAIGAGLKLVVATTFAADLVCGTGSSWTNAEVYCKFRVNDTNRFSACWIGINDDGATNTGSTAGTLGTSWGVMCHTQDVSSWGRQNLRAVATFQGPSSFSAAAIGQSAVDIEWFAIRLTDEE